MSSHPADKFAANVKQERENNPVEITTLDDAVLAALPQDSKIQRIIPSGISAWCDTVRIDLKLNNGTVKRFFMKSQSGEVGRRMMEGSFESESEYYKYAASNVPRPLAFGAYESHPDTWFYLSTFHDLVDELPDVQDFVSIIARVHRYSMGKSPTGKYGFHVPTHLADVPNDNTWQSTWEAWYLQALRTMYAYKTSIQGTDDAELASVFQDLCTKVVPRLLRPLESGGRTIQPCLIHSDLWPGNCMPEAGTGKLMIFDSCAFWGHNEADLGSWRAPRYRMGRPFIEAYRKLVGASEPKEDFEDRIALYAIRYDLLTSGLYPEHKTFRKLAEAEIRRLVEKYPDGIDGFKG